MKLVQKTRVGSQLRRQYDAPQTPFERVRACPEADPAKVAELARLRATMDPFALAARIDQQLRRVYGFANQRRQPVDAAGPVEAKNASTRSLENPKSGFSTAPTGPSSLSQQKKTTKTSVTRLMAR